METLQEYDEWKAGYDPVRLGRASWVTGPYREAMRLCRVVIGG